MRHVIALLSFAAVLGLTSCSKKEGVEPARPGAAGQPRATVQLKDGTKIPGAIVESTPTDMVVAGNDGIERKIPLTQVKSVEYADAPPPERQAGGAAASVVTTRTSDLPAGSVVSVRTNETIDSATTSAGRVYDADVTRDAKDEDGNIVIPRGASARLVIRAASQGGRIKGSPSLVLDLESVVIHGKTYAIETSAISQRGRSGVGANKRTAEYTGGGAAVGAIIGAIAGGGRGAAIGAGAGAGAGALTQIVTRGGSIKVPAETVLTFRLNEPLRVTAAQ